MNQARQDMKEILCLLFFFVTTSCGLYAQENVPCWVSGDVSKVITSQEAILKTYLLPIHLNDPEGDAEIRISHGDYRLVGITGIGLEYPSLDKSKEGQILCEFGGRYIQGTSDVYESDVHAQLISKFTEYAKAYNAVIISYYKRTMQSRKKKR